MERFCLECDTKLKGRADQKFCSPECRTQYNNRQRREELRYIRKINKVLKKNRKILCELNKNGKTKIQRRSLFERGFRFDYFTNRLRTQKGKTYFFCYDQGFLELEDDVLLLVENQLDIVEYV